MSEAADTPTLKPPRLRVGADAVAGALGFMLWVASGLMACLIVPSVWLYGWPRPTWGEAAGSFFASLPWFNRNKTRGDFQ